VAPIGPHDDSGVVAVGTVLADRYRIEGVLGSGGMGRVYRGEHVTIGKPVAVKVLHSALGKNQEATVRFQREALASGRLDHPNIVGVLDFGTLENGRLYLVMEVLTGEHLGQRLDRDKRIPWPESLAIIRSVLSGLRHAHERGVVHRDIKPDNVFLATKNEDTVVKILDFGIAKLYGQITADDQQATRAGITVGTPKYLSPEQAVGGEITPAADLYSASVLLYEMLVGRPPFDSEDPLTLLTAHACGEVPTFHDVAPDLEVPEAVEELVRHGLGKLVSERIGSAAEYTQRIDEIMRANGVDPRATPALGSPVIPDVGARGTPVGTPTPLSLSVASSRPARPATAPSAPEEPARRRRWAAIAAIAVVAGVAGAVGFGFLRGDGVQRGQPVASAPPVDARQAPPARPKQPPPPIVKQAPAAAASPAPSTSVKQAPPSDAKQAPAAPRTVARDHDKQLAADLHELQAGATCTARKKAVAKLVALGDRSAVTALQKARARGKANACLLSAADQAIKTLKSK
jgi:serine/threonine-protein kinase